MKNVLSFVNLHDNPSLGELTKSRPLGATTFLGRYGLMDFALSNLSNSNIDKINILVESHIHSIRSHIQTGQIWISNTKRGRLGEYINEKTINTPKFNTDIANIIANFSPLQAEIKEDYIVIAPPFFVMSFDYRPLLEKHIESKADVTLVYSHRTDADSEFINCDALEITSEGRIKGVKTNTGKGKEKDIFLETYIVNRNVFIEMIEEASRVSRLYNLRDMLKYYIYAKSYKICGYRFDGLVLPILTFNDFVNYSFKMLKHDYFNGIFKEDWPIYTTTHNTPPCAYGENASVKNSFLANGCNVKGKVENSILSRRVIIEEGAEVKNSILFSNTVVKSGMKLNNVVCGKRCVFTEKKKVSGSKEEPLFIENDSRI